MNPVPKVIFWLLGLLPCWLPAQVYELRLREPTPLDEVMQELATAYGWELAYPSDLMEGKMVPPLQWRGNQPDGLLDRLLPPLGIAWQRPDSVRLLLRPGPVRAAPLRVQGQVLDAADGRPLAGVAISVSALRLGTYSDAQGHFALALPAGAGDALVELRLIGYAARQVSAAALAAAGGLRLEARPLALAPVQIVEARPGLVIDPLALRLRPGHLAAGAVQGPAGADPLQAVQRLPGVAAWQDRQAALEIRGSPGAETLLLLDGLPIYGAGHYFGIYSAIDGQYVDEITLYKNALPLAYGGYTGGLVEMKGPQAVNQTAARLHLSTLTASLRLDIAASPRWAVVVQGRSSYGNAAESLLMGQALPEVVVPRSTGEAIRGSLVETAPRLRFYDGHVKVLYQPGKRHQVDLSLFHSRDTFANAYEATYTTLLRRQPVTNAEAYRQSDGWTNTGAVLTYRGEAAGGRRRWDTRLFTSTYAREARLTAGFWRSGGSDSLRYLIQTAQANRLATWGADANLRQQVGRAGEWQVGLGVTHHANRYLAQAQERAVLQGEDTGWLGHAYGAYGWSQGPWRVEGGLRLYVYEPTRRLYGSPRLQATRSLPAGWRLKAALSRDHQFVRQLDHETPLGQQIALLALAHPEGVPVGPADQVMVGALWQRGRWTLDAELYHKRWGEVLEHALEVPGFAVPGSPCRGCTYRTYSGQGQGTGLDLLLRQEGRYLRGWVAYTLSRHTRSFAEILDGRAFPAQNDRRHQLSWTEALAWQRWQLSGTYTYASGRPYTDFSVLTQGRDRRDLSPEARIRRLPAYHRLDLDLAYAWTRPRYQGRVGASVYNLTGRANVDFVQYIYAVPGEVAGSTARVIGAQTNLLGRTFNLRLELAL